MTARKRPGITCRVCGAEVITVTDGRRRVTRRLVHRADGTHAMERVS